MWHPAAPHCTWPRTRATWPKADRRCTARLLKGFWQSAAKCLLLKLEHCGVRGPLLSWIGDFLAERTLESTTPEEAAVTSGVPQGTVLGPLLFLVYINDLPACGSSEARLFADDCLLYRTIKSQRDADILQDDLNILQQWEAKWLMSLNPDKCEVFRVTNKRKNIIQSQYTIHGTVLNTVDKTEYLGVTIRSKLNWKPHISNISKKANNIRAFLHRHLTRCPAPIKEQACKTYVRPILEYGPLSGTPILKNSFTNSIRCTGELSDSPHPTIAADTASP